MADAPFTPAQRRATVRLLEWEEIMIDRGDGSEEESGDYEAVTPFCTRYYIEQGFGTDSYIWTVMHDGSPVGSADDPDRAKEIAQNHFADCVLACLTPAGIEARKQTVEEGG